MYTEISNNTKRLNYYHQIPMRFAGYSKQRKTFSLLSASKHSCNTLILVKSIICAKHPREYYPFSIPRSKKKPRIFIQKHVLNVLIGRLVEGSLSFLFMSGNKENCTIIRPLPFSQTPASFLYAAAPIKYSENRESLPAQSNQFKTS